MVIRFRVMGTQDFMGIGSGLQGQGCRDKVLRGYRVEG